MLQDFAGFGVSGYRSFGRSETVYIGPMDKVHLVVGQNNVGKSNVLNFMHRVLSRVRGNVEIDSSQPIFSPMDVSENWNQNAPREISLAFYLGGDLEKAFGKFGEGNLFQDLFSQEAYSRSDNNVAWLDFELSTDTYRNNHLTPCLRQFEAAIKQAGLAPADIYEYASRVATLTGETLEVMQGAIWRSAAPWSLIPPTVWVDGIREITEHSYNEGEELRTGRGLIPQLAALQSPNYSDYKQSRFKFEALERFVQSVLSDPRARIEIPREADTIHVTTGQASVRVLESLGTGISEIIHLAAVATVVNDSIICIEEPESHLHPALQRKLIAYLHSDTNNRYLMSTHSAAFLNSEIASISHVTLNGGNSEVTGIASPATLAHAVSDLGYRASDLVQSNFLIWVEGPSDRIYVNHWLEMRQPGLVEGGHYSIMFYGGALLNHLSVNDEETHEFISLLHINRNVAIVIDSDRSLDSDGINQTKTRVVDELRAIDGIDWVTHGYTVENYAKTSVLQKAVSDKYPGKNYNVPESRYESPLGSTFDGITTKPSKIIVARAMVDLATTEEDWHPELWPKVDRLGGAILRANGQSADVPTHSP